MRKSASGVVFKNTDQLWGAVVGKLSNEIRENVYVPEGRAHFFIKHHGKHIGVKDFRYTILYSASTKTASVTVETPEGGEEAKAAIQKFIDSHSEGNILKGVAAKQGVKNKKKWSWAVTKEAEELNDELVRWYVDTINAFYQFFETPIAKTADANKKTTYKELRITIGADNAFEEVQVHPIILKESEKILKDNNMDAEASWGKIAKLNHDFDSDTELRYYFIPMGLRCYLYVGEADQDGEIIKDEHGGEIYDYDSDGNNYIMGYGEFDNTIRARSFNEVADDEEQTEELKEFFKKIKFDSTHTTWNYFSTSFEKAFKDLENNKACEETFIPTAMAEAVRQFDEWVRKCYQRRGEEKENVVSPTMNAKAILHGTTADDYATMSYFINLPEDEKFDIDKLKFVNIDAGYGDYSDVLGKHIGDDMVCLNMIIYDGVMYFAGRRNINLETGRDYDILKYEQDYDIVDGEMKSIE